MQKIEGAAFPALLPPRPRRGGPGQAMRRSQVCRLLRGCFEEVLPLEAFVKRLQEKEAKAGGLPAEPLIQDGDPKCFRVLVERCLVGRPRGGKAPPPRLVFQQIFSQHDIIARVIRRICEKKKKNVLAFGYDLLDENHFPLPHMPNLYSYFPNNTTETICQSILWEKILNRVGDDFLMYILEHCSLFMLVPPSCCYQICGQPVYEIAFKDSTSFPKFLRQRYPGPKHSTLSGYLRRRRFSSYKQHTARGNRKKWHPRRKLGSKANNILEGSYQQSLLIQTVKQNFTVSASECPESKQRTSECKSLTTRSLKRKWKGHYEMSAKRMKIMKIEDGLQKETGNLVHTQSKHQLSLDGDNAASKSSTSFCLADQLTPVTSVLHSNECGEQISGVHVAHLDHRKSFLSSKTMTLVSGSKAHCEPSTKIDSVDRSTKQEGGIRSTQMVSAKGATARRDFRVHNSTSSEKSSDNTSFKRYSLLYCHRQLHECLPNSFVLNKLKGSPSGGQSLVEIVFFTSQIPKQLDSSNQSHSKRKKRLPKRYWQMRGLFQELLQKHAKCPYLGILKRNCPIWISDSIRYGTEEQACEEKVNQERRHSSQESQEANTIEYCPSSVTVGLGHFPRTSGASSRSCGETELGQKVPEEQPILDSSTSNFRGLLKQHSSHWQVYTFVRECLQRVVPAELWGSSYNKCRFYKNVKKFISLGKLATFSMQELMWKMRVNDCTWLRLSKGPGHFVPASEHHFRQDLMSKFFYWLMDSYVTELLRSFFYITETMFQKNLLFFFRKTVWSKLETIGLRNHLAKVHLHALSEEKIKNLQQEKYVPLASKLRFIPKTNGLRPVVRLDSVVGAKTFCEKIRERKVQLFKTQLKNLFSVLNYERIKNPALLGSSVFGKDDIFAAWKQFVLKILELNEEMPKFYFVKADVMGAYDSIPHDKLEEVVLQALSPNKKTITYSIRRYAVIIRTRNGLLRKYYRRHASTYKEFKPEMNHFVSHLQESTSLRNAVVVEQSISLKETSSHLSEFFSRLIRNSILKIKDSYYVQNCGIPQGSILSTLLCNMCYGDMENKLLRGIQKDGILMRLTDDFLLVTPHLTQAKTFLRTLAMGIPEYGFVINASKTVVNFSVDEDIPGLSGFKQLPSHCMFPWCGLLIDTQTLEVYCDYSSYSCTSIRSSLSFNSSVKAGVSMRNKLLDVLKLKCHSLFVDLQINSLRTVCINVYKILLLQAYRFHACVLQLPFDQKIKSNPSFFLGIISQTASCCFCILKTKHSDIPFSAAGISSPLTYKAVQWLCYHAFSVKLAIHRVIYKCLLVPLAQRRRGGGRHVRTLLLEPVCGSEFQGH
ncbi:telomerase reverse transcriptase isoform X3 [Anolis carolinensis]|uniref:telomerase reverse transcriptase isoform X3 n=1 Tax=Anolis carolinensis TaxID=28377 RepID=UPI002F2B5C79